MSLEIRQNSPVYRWFELYLRLGGGGNWTTNRQLFVKIFLEAPILWLFSAKMDGHFRVSPMLFWAIGFILGYWKG